MLKINNNDSPYYKLTLYFFIYSFLGWCLETIAVFVEFGVFIKRGFIFGPFCIIYGFTIGLLITLLKPIKNNLLLYFIFSALIITTLEYITGFALEYIFDRRWWDYSTKPLNLQGYISLGNSLIWGGLALIIHKYFHPKLETLITNISLNKAFLSSKVLLFFFTVNILISIIYQVLI